MRDAVAFPGVAGRISWAMRIQRAQRRTTRFQYDPDKRVISPERGDGRRISPEGLPWFTSLWDVRLVERVRSAASGIRSTASFALPRVHGGSEVVASRSLIYRRRWLAAGFVLALLLGTNACGGDDDNSTPTTTSRQSTTTTSQTTTSSSAAAPDDAAVEAAYDAANRAFIDAAAIPDPNFGAISATHTGPMLDQRRDVLRALQVDGRVIRYPANSQYRVVIKSIRTEDGVSRIQFCAVDDAERVDAKTGEVISQGVVTVRGEAALRQEGGVWKLAEQRFDSRIEGSASCD